MIHSQTKISVKVQPNAGKNQVVGLVDGVWKIKIGAPPDKGKANQELIEFLSDLLRIRKDRITILHGQTSHNKVILIEDLPEDEVLKKILPPTTSRNIPRQATTPPESGKYRKPSL
jgi:uncharacterized protein (TIGR00251 family)